MKRTRLAWVLLAASIAVVAADEDPVLQAMRDEMQRARALKVVNLEAPYFISYSIDDADSFTASATLGGLVRSNRNRFRLPRVQVRVGDYAFDNTNYIGSNLRYTGGYDIDRFPIESAYPVLRRYLWLATDEAYKSALEAIARKRAALRNVSVVEQIADFSKAAPLKRIEEARLDPFDEDAWSGRLRKLSAGFARYPALRSSSLELEAVQNVSRLVNSEGTEVRYSERAVILRARAYGQAPDGMPVRDAVVFHAKEFSHFPSDAEITRAVAALGDHVTALTQAPMGEFYSGPVVFEREAAAQLFAQVLARNFALFRRPVMEPGRSAVFPASELEGRIGARILPEWIDVVDDPTQTEWRGRPLIGHYRVDLEGVPAAPLTLVEKGVLKNYLLTRQPMRGFSGSNGRARLPGPFGASQAAIGSLFVRATQAVPSGDLKQKLVELCKARGKAYGLLIRKMDYPSSASMEEARRLLTGSAQSGSSARPVSIPILAYKVFQDGREELVRGLRFRGLNSRALKDILAASDESYLFEFLDNAAPMALMGAGGYVVETSVVAPSVLVDDVELEKIEEEFPKIPVVPPPS